ncbi:NAD-dependent epimerase/dehydratase family protein [Marispirochaeta sp.]|uniref:NAD-dependent epimerase/dehydratase family protein n=1 Tax=Marispirochaeta sp. TaxID=2038653 RepID=UPI0029C796A1|nr:NAD-dependent epimerase/dehydratase family protein [Marispirochaeta sp.]
MKILVIGGTGVISRELVRQLADSGMETSIVNRGRRSISLPSGVEVLHMDRKNKEGFAKLFENRKYDAVIDMVAFEEADARQTVEIFRNKTNQIMIVSSVAAYERPIRAIPTREDQVTLWKKDTGYTYGYKKAVLERYLNSESDAGVPITIIRPSLTFGDGARNVGVLRQNMGIIERIRRGKPLIMFGDGNHPWSFTFTPDLARMMIRLLGNRKAIGEAFHLVSQEQNNWLDLYYGFGKITGKEPELVHIASPVLYKQNPELFGHIYFEKSHSGYFSNTKYLDATGDSFTNMTLDQGLQQLKESWERDGLQVDPKLDVMEDTMIEAVRRGYEALNSLT